MHSLRMPLEQLPWNSRWFLINKIKQRLSLLWSCLLQVWQRLSYRSLVSCSVHIQYRSWHHWFLNEVAISNKITLFGKLATMIHSESVIMVDSEERWCLPVRQLKVHVNPVQDFNATFKKVVVSYEFICFRLTKFSYNEWWSNILYWSIPTL